MKPLTADELLQLIKKEGEPILAEVVSTYKSIKRDHPIHKTVGHQVWFREYAGHIDSFMDENDANDHGGIDVKWQLSWHTQKATFRPIKTKSGQEFKKLYTNKTTIMSNIKDKFTRLFLTKEERDMRDAGITNGDNQLTEDGKDVFLNWLFLQNKSAFHKEVVSQLKEDK